MIDPPRRTPALPPTRGRKPADAGSCLARKELLMKHRYRWVVGTCILATVSIALPARAAESAFAYKTSYRNVTKDPDNIWTGAVLAPNPKGTVTIHEYQLQTQKGEWLISQIWNEDCSSETCPTRLVQIGLDGHRVILVDDMMHQIVPPNDPRFTGMSMTKAQAAFAQHPFLLSDDGKTLLNGDYKFQIAGGKP
jgi:hypothetical protein